MRVEIRPHCRRRMAERGITPEEMAQVWLNPELDRPSDKHSGARVRTGRRPDGSTVTVVGELREADQVLVFYTAW